MASSPNNPSLSAAGADLGLGDMLGQQVSGETEEQRKKRMATMEQQRLLGPSGSMAVNSLLGPSGGKSAGY